MQEHVRLPGEAERHLGVVALQPGEGAHRLVELLTPFRVGQVTLRACPRDLVLTEQPQRRGIVAKVGSPLELSLRLGPPDDAVGGHQKRQVELGIAVGDGPSEPVQDGISCGRGHVAGRVDRLPAMRRLQDQQHGQVVDLGSPAPDQLSG